MKVALLGVWHVHATDYTAAALRHGAEVIGFYEKDDTLAEGYMKRYPIHRFKTREELLESPAEGIIVCSSTEDHTEDIIAAARAEKNIFTEKVLALTDKECEMIEKVISECGVGFTISMPQKYLASRIAIKKTVESGELGKISYLRFRNCHSGSSDNWLPAHFYSRKQCGGGAMIDLGAHGMYIINWLLGMPKSAASVFTLSSLNPEACRKNADKVEDNAVTVMKYADGTIAINETGFVYSGCPITLEVHGELGYVRMEGERVTKRTKSTDFSEVELQLGESLPLPIEQFIKGTPLPGCSITEAKALTHMMEMAYAAVR